MLDAQTQARMANCEARMRERGVVDVKFFKNPEYYKLSANEQANELCDVIECMLDGRSTKVEGLGDTVGEVLFGLLRGGNASPITLSPVARCGGGRLGDDNEEGQPSGTTPS